MALDGRHREILMFLFLWLMYSPIVQGAENTSWKSNTNNVTDVKVGVILDTSSPDGDISWSCMQLALEDIYEEHPNYSTRTSLVLRDLKNEPHDAALGAAVAAVDLLNNVQVHAIIGPQTATQAEFLIALGNKSNVPVISFSAKCPSTSFSQTPYFFRTSWDDSSQAIVIASIAQKFNWREIVPVFEDTDSGNMFVPYLVDTLQEVDAHVPYRCKIPSMASESEIDSALNYLNANRTRVFVVHMSYNLSLKFFSRAKEKNMMGTDEFVWITTYGLTDIVDIFGSDASDKMQGVLGIRPLVPNTARVQGVSKRLRKKYQVNSEPPAFCLWAYDTVWLLAKSVEHLKDVNLSFKASNSQNNSTDFSKIRVSEMGTNLKALLKSANFNGTSGDFKLVNGQLQSGSFVITNVDGAYNAPVGNWSRGNISINWPERNRTPPKGWQWPITGEYLRIGVPSSGFKVFVNWTGDEHNKSPGYCIELFEDVMKQLPYNVSYKFEEYGDPKGDFSYNDLVYQVYLKNYDAVIGDITILANRSIYVDFTLPYIESGVRMVVPVKDVNTKTPWAFLEPWTAKLWLTTGAFFLLTGITVWFIEHRVNKEFRGGPVNQMGSTFYFAFSTLVFAHKESLVSNLSRLVVIIWVFVVLILQQSYTASLTSKLTVEQLQATVKSIDQIIKDNQKVGYLGYSFVKGLLQRLGVRESNLVALSSPDDYNWALSNGIVAAVVDEIPYVKVFLSKYPNNYAMVGPTYKSEGFGFAFSRGSPLVQDVSTAILKVMESINLTKYAEELYGNRPFTDKESQEVQTSLTFHSFMGLFLLTGASSILALIIHMLCAIYQKHNSPTNIEAALDLVEKDEPRAEDQSNDHTMNYCDYVVVGVSPDSRSVFEESISAGGTPGREISLTNLGE